MQCISGTLSFTMAVRKRLYIDGNWIGRLAFDACDASLNWLDVASLSMAVGTAPGINACYFGLFDADDPESETRIRSLQAALTPEGVSFHLRSEIVSSMECTRCGHGWEHHPDRALAADLALTIAADAAADIFDAAFVLTDPATVSALQRHVVSRYPQKTIIAPDLSAVDLMDHRLSARISLASGVILHRPWSWAPPAFGRRTERPSSGTLSADPGNIG